MHKIATAAALAGGLVLATAGTAAADQIVVDVPQRVIFGGPPGAEFLLAEEAVEAEHRGLVCMGDLVAQNNESVHPGNDIRVSSGTDAVVPDVEGSPNKTTPLSAPITLGEQIRVTLIMGPDEIFSGAFRLELDCELPTQEPPPAPETPTQPDGGGGAVAPTGGQAPAVGSAGNVAAVGQQLPSTGPGETMLVAALGAFFLALGVGFVTVTRTRS